MGYNITHFCSVLGVFSISLENKPTVPVGYHIPCRSAERAECQEHITPLCTGYNKHSTQLAVKKQTKSNLKEYTYTCTQMMSSKLKKILDCRIFSKGQNHSVVCLTLAWGFKYLFGSIYFQPWPGFTVQNILHLVVPKGGEKDVLSHSHSGFYFSLLYWIWLLAFIGWD